MKNIIEDSINSTSLSIYMFYVDICLDRKHYGVVFSVSLMLLCFLVATPANAWCLWFCLKTKSKQSPVFLMNQIIMEMIFSVECFLETINDLIYRKFIYLRGVSFFYGTPTIGKPLLQTCICMEQYLAVIYPVTFLRLKGSRYRIGVTAACWSMAAGYGVYLSYSLKFPDCFFISVFIVAVLVISFCCVSVLCALKNPKPGDQHQKSSDVGNQQKRNAFNTISTALILTLLTYLPQTLLLCVNRVDFILYLCDLIPLSSFLYCFGVIITPLLKMYNEGFFNLKRLAESSQSNS